MITLFFVLKILLVGYHKHKFALCTRLLLVSHKKLNNVFVQSIQILKDQPLKDLYI